MRVIFHTVASRDGGKYLTDRLLDAVPEHGTVHINGQTYVVVGVEWFIGNEQRFETPDARIHGDHVIVKLR